MENQANSTSSSENCDEQARRPAPGTNAFFNEMIYCTCKLCKNRKLKKRRLVRIHILKHGVYIEEPLLVHNILENQSDSIDDSDSQGVEQDTCMDDSTSQLNEDGVRQFGKEASEEDLKYALLHGSQGLRQHMLDRGEKLVFENQPEVAQQLNSSTKEVDSEHEEALEAHDGSAVAHNESMVVPEPPRETTPEFQQRGEWDNEHVQHDEQATSSIRLLPSQKWIKRKRTVFHYTSK